LLEPWAAHPGKYPAAWADLLDQLGEVYVKLRKPRKRKTLAQALVERGEPEVQAKGWQRLAMMATDAGNPDEAMEALAKAQRCAPDDPSMAPLEVLLLLNMGRAGEAKDRAQFHIKRLERRNQSGEYDELISGLHSMAQEGMAFVKSIGLTQDPELGKLDAWSKQLTAPQLRVVAQDANSDESLELAVAAELEAPLELWLAAFDLDAPQMTMMFSDAGDPWAAFPQWMRLLEKYPVLADSFEVLDDLVRALRMHLNPAGEAIALRFTDRALALWSALRAQYPARPCPWVIMTNRPALRLVAQHIMHDQTPDAQHSFEWLRQMVEVLNPNDNHGFRSRLAAVMLRRGLNKEALALTDRYPDDSSDMMLARVLALWHCGQRDAATSLLADILRSDRQLAKVMQSAIRPRPRYGDYIAVGSPQEAQITYVEQFDLWQEPELRQLIKACKPRG
jgi:tetratricopeptide (TPR) repeat protein